MSKRINFSNDELALLSAVLDYASNNMGARISYGVTNKTDLLALRFTQRGVDRLRARLFPKPILTSAQKKEAA